MRKFVSEDFIPTDIRDSRTDLDETWNLHSLWIGITLGRLIFICVGTTRVNPRADASSPWLLRD